MPPKADKLTMTTTGNKSGSVSNGEVKCKGSYYDKQSGSYGRVTTKESVSSGDYSNRGRVGYKDEYKTSSTVRVGDKRGYTEYSKQEKFERVDYAGSKHYYSGIRNQICDDDVGVDPDGSSDDEPGDEDSCDNDGDSGDDYDNDDFEDDDDDDDDDDDEYDDSYSSDDY